jgi:PAS domain S-box-containing protein
MPGLMLLALAAVTAVLVQGRSPTTCLLVIGVSLTVMSVLGAVLALGRARAAPAEASGWRWLALHFLLAIVQSVVLELGPRYGWGRPVWIPMALGSQLAGIMAVARWPWRVRNAPRMGLHLLGSALFCGSMLLVTWSAYNWRPVLNGTGLMDGALLTASLRVCLFGGISVYLLADRPARWRGPVGWVFLNALLGLVTQVVFYRYLVGGVSWLMGPLAVAVVAANSTLILAAYSGRPVEPVVKDTVPSPIWEFLPFAAFILAACLALVRYLGRAEEARPAVLGLFALLVPLLWRQILLQREGQVANLNLEARVQDRTRDLEAARVQLLQEVAERRRAEEAQGRAAAHLRTLFDALPDLVWLKSPEGVYQGCNRRFERAMGHREAELIGHNDYDFLDRAQADFFRDYDLRAIAAGGPVMNEERITFSDDGHQEDLETIKTPILGPDQEVLGVLGIGRDITGRKRSEEALVRAFAAMEQSGSSIVITDTTGAVEYVNHAFTTFTGYTAREVLGRNLRLLKSGTHSAEFYQELWSTLVAGRTWRGRFHNKHKDGTLYWEQAVISPVRDSGGQITHFVAAKENITETLKLEHERHQLEQQISHSQKLESLGNLAGGVAHDMNNVLGAILAMASAHQENLAETDPMHRVLGTISRAAGRGGQLVKSLLKFARQTPAEQGPVELNGVLQEVAQLLKWTTLAKVGLDLDVDPALPAILGDAGALTHAIMNLCVNAVDAMGHDGHLWLRTRNLGGGQVEVTVRDNGCGMPPEVLSRAMDPFFTTKGVGKGTGLGLSMVYGTVQAHGGQLEMASSPGQGTTVSLRFPILAAADPAPGSAAGAFSGAAKALELLVVDDDEFMQSALGDLVARLGHRALLAERGEDALDRLEAGDRVDGVILDINMPGLGGAETLRRIRAGHPLLPVLLITGKADPAALDLAGEFPAVAFLPKPFSLDQLHRQLEDWS